LSCIDEKQQQNDRKLYANDLGEKRSHLGLVFIPKIMGKRFGKNYSYLWLVSIFDRFSYLGSCSFFFWAVFNHIGWKQQ